MEALTVAAFNQVEGIQSYKLNRGEGALAHAAFNRVEGLQPFGCV